ncbi:MAG: c-type cytochrome, partial [Planctomycetota bacterium]|nr:c-type cytochrome [Planctomycetota bacterium]
PATPSSPSGMTAPAAGAAEAPPDAKDAPAAEPKPAPAAEPQAGKDPAAEPKVEPKRDDPQEAEAKRDDPETLRRKADALRAKLAKLPLAEDVIEQGGRYDEAFTAAFGNPRVNAQRIARAIGAYSRSIASTTSPYDRFAAGQLDALSESAKRGLSLFQGEGRCATCHTLEGSHAALTDFGFHNTGVVWNRLSEDDRQRLAAHDETFRRKQDDLERPAAADEGRARISTRKGDLRAFKTPTLRDVARRGPYMHDGSFATLRDVVAYYARGASPDPAKASHVRAFAANERDVDDLVAFLESLNGEERPGLPAKAWRERADRTQLQFVDADGRPLAGLDVELAAVGDLAHAGAEIHAVPARLRTDDKGLIEFCNRRTTHTRLALPGGLVPTDGALVPDSCRKARVRVPVRGRTTLLVRFGDGVEPPAVLAAEHLGTIELPGHDRPRTRFARGDVLDLGRGTLVRYEAWLRTDVPASVQLRVPGLDEAKSHFVLERDQPIRVDLTTK